MAEIEELRARVDELAVLKERAKGHLEEVRTVNRNREDEARLNYLDFIDRWSDAQAELERELDFRQTLTI